MCEKAILENGGTLKSVPDWMCNKAVYYYPHALEFVPECYKTQNICDKAVPTPPPTIKYVSECYKTQEMCYKTVHRC